MEFLEKLKPLALLLMRCALGTIYMSHGFPKLFGQTARMQQFFSSAGIPPAWVYVVGVLELFGGGLLILGLFTRVLGLLFAIEMSVAIWRVHFHSILAVKDYEFPLVMCAAALTLAAVGAGVVSLDYPLFRGKAKPRPKG